MHEQPVPGPHHRMRNTIIIMAVLAVVLVVALAVAVWWTLDRQQDGSKTLESTAVDSTTLPATVPFRMVENHIVVDAVLGEETSPRPLILDTGAPTIISDEVADAVGGEPAGTVTTVAIDGTKVADDVVPISSLRLGDARFTDVGAIKGFLEPGNPLLCISEHGLIGASLMKEGVWQIDYDAGLVTIAEDTAGLEHIDGAIELPFTSPTTMSPSPVVELTVGDGSLTFILDTGSDAWFAVNPADLQGTGVEVSDGAPTVMSVGAGAAGTYESRIEFVTADVGVGDQQLEGVPLATLPTLEAGQGNIGNDFLSHYVLTIDWPGRTIYLDPLTDEPRPTIPDSATFSWGGESIVVGSVVEGTPGYDDTVTPGAPVRAIGGVDVSGATFDDFCQLSDEHAGGAYEMTVATDTATTVSVAPVEGFYDVLDG